MSSGEGGDEMTPCSINMSNVVGIMVPKGATNKEMYDFLVDHYVGTTGSGLRRTGKTKSVTDTVDLGDYGLSQGDLNNGILGLYDYSGQPVKREKLSRVMLSLCCLPSIHSSFRTLSLLPIRPLRGHAILASDR